VREQLKESPALGLISSKELERFYRIEYVSDTAKNLSWVFLTEAILLFISVVFLTRQMVRGKKSVRDLPEVFESEAKNLTCILVFFVSTYFLRFLSD
jgi:hypothetical protein